MFPRPKSVTAAAVVAVALSVVAAPVASATTPADCRAAYNWIEAFKGTVQRDRAEVHTAQADAEKIRSFIRLSNDPGYRRDIRASAAKVQERADQAQGRLSRDVQRLHVAEHGFHQRCR